jgi:iron complex outermembrane receptor protein
VDLGLNYAWTHARYDEFHIFNLFGSLFGIGCTNGKCLDNSQSPFADTPENVINGNIRVRLPINETLGKLYLYGEVSWQSDQYLTNLAGAQPAPGVFIDPVGHIPAYAVTNFRIDWNNIRGTNASAGVFIRNAFNTTYYTGGVPTGFEGTDVASVGDPRTFGVELTYRFGGG